MKKSYAAFALVLVLLLGACGPKPYYDTRVGKKKQKYYNDIQFGKNSHPKKNW